jgi:hypothetical protein
MVTTFLLFLAFVIFCVITLNAGGSKIIDGKWRYVGWVIIVAILFRVVHTHLHLF